MSTCLAVSPAMEKFLERYVLKYSNQQTRLDMLINSCRQNRVFWVLNMMEAHTMTSNEAFRCAYG